MTSGAQYLAPEQLAGSTRSAARRRSAASGPAPKKARARWFCASAVGACIQSVSLIHPNSRSLDSNNPGSRTWKSGDSTRAYSFLRGVRFFEFFGESLGQGVPTTRIPTT